MKALLSVDPGGPESLVLSDVPIPDPGPGQLRVRVLGCGINYPDVLVIEDKYQFKPQRPFAPGVEDSGIVDAVGDGVTGWEPGDSAPLAGVAGAATAPPATMRPMPVPVPSTAVQMASTEPTGRVERVAVPSSNHLYVQVGAFSNIANARRLMNSLGGDLRISAIQRNGQTLYRVRTPALASVTDADAALARINGQSGGEDARIIVDQ